MKASRDTLLRMFAHCIHSTHMFSPHLTTFISLHRKLLFIFVHKIRVQKHTLYKVSTHRYMHKEKHKTELHRKTKKCT